MADITNPRLLYLKGGLFLVCGSLACGLILAECPSITVAVLLVIAIWCFARAYYFAFYVIQHYIDPGYRFAGLWSFAKYAWARRRERSQTVKEPTPETDQPTDGNVRPDAHPDRSNGPSEPRF